MAEKLDIILFGVSGFTGKHALKYVHKFASAKGRQLTWGVAGRNETRIRTILSDLEKETGDANVSKVPIILADLSDVQSIQNMASRARLLINCCGPYRFMGETVVKACVEAGTHHVDVSGEPMYMEKMQLEYNEKAKEKGIYIVSACGLDSIPCDLGLIFLQKKFEGTLNSVETFLKTGSEDPALSGPAINYGTWESAVYGMANADQLRPLRTKLFPKRLPKLEPRLATNKIPFKAPVGDEWAVIFPGSDRSVMLRTQRYLYEEKKQRPVQVQTYFLVASIWQLMILTVFGLVFSILSKFQFGRNLLLKYPSLFTGGIFDTKEPSEEMIEKSWFKISLLGKGWKENLSGPEDQYKNPPNKGILAEVRGKNPGYGSTCICLVLAGIVILTEPSNLPKAGGVYPPGAAFAETSLIEQLDENGVTFKVIKEFDISE
ncbi:saccharopine dehydrogenase-like oxidoreductase [Coccinella septempunctata]|uniref:saccharopine dehydrogenase-like oxidoreductase n=1 Tax=Coccinella septempunctata TaxID=41139 RepID=UPI001D05D57A|nr:saccharopine dehydrogenase-like oxidoreductase [Coccinella septempunctata]